MKSWINGLSGWLFAAPLYMRISVFAVCVRVCVGGGGGGGGHSVMNDFFLL